METSQPFEPLRELDGQVRHMYARVIAHDLPYSASQLAERLCGRFGEEGDFMDGLYDFELADNFSQDEISELVSRDVTIKNSLAAEAVEETEEAPLTELDLLQSQRSQLLYGLRGLAPRSGGIKDIVAQLKTVNANIFELDQDDYWLLLTQPKTEAPEQISIPDVLELLRGSGIPKRYWSNVLSNVDRLLGELQAIMEAEGSL